MSDYDPRQRQKRGRRSYEEDASARRRDRSRSRSRSRSPDNKKAQMEAQRRARMERLRAENEEEEKKLAALEEKEDKKGHEKSSKPQESIIKVNESELEGLNEEEQMQMLLGFGGFGTTKGQKVEDNYNSSARGAAAKNKARKYRQYMNRKNGFNRPLDKMD